MNRTFLASAWIIFGLGFTISFCYQSATAQNLDGINKTSLTDSLETRINLIDVSEPIYQTVTGQFLDTKEISSTPDLITRESFLEQAIMKDAGNVTNKMTFINTYDANSTIIQGRGNGTISTPDGQSIGWISDDIGVLSERGPIFHGIILFNSTNSEKLSFLNGKLGLYKDAPEIHRTIWLIT